MQARLIGIWLADNTPAPAGPEAAERAGGGAMPSPSDLSFMARAMARNGSDREAIEWFLTPDE